MRERTGRGRKGRRHVIYPLTKRELKRLAVTMASPSHSQRPYEYLDALLATLPHESIPQDIMSTCLGAGHSSSPYPKFIDTLLRLVSGGPGRADEAPHLGRAWPEIQVSVQRSLDALHHPSSSSSSTQPPTKRKYDPSSPAANQKKPKYERGEGNGQAGDAVDEDDTDDAPHLTLHALSATAPVRHKVDITLHARKLRLAHSTTGAATARCARTALTRAFLLPTRARSSGALQWAALLLAGDKPAPPAPKGARAASGSGAANTAGTTRFELACSVSDSTSAAVPRMTVHSPPSASAPPSQPVNSREALFTLLSSIISGTSVTLTTVERAGPIAGITAFRGVRETSLWFFGSAGAGILADARPAEFWALADLARGEAGVRVRTATGRTCSVVLTRRSAHANEEAKEEEEGEETEFQMIDGKERDGILEWVRKHRDAFGIAPAQRGAQAPQMAGTTAEAKDGEGAGAGGDSDSDSDFEVSSASSDGGSPSSGSNSGAGSGSDAESGEGEDDGSEHGSQGGENDDDGDEDAVELDPKHHPLLRAGALPKMLRAAMDAAVGLVVGDLVGKAGRSSPGPAKAGPWHPVARDESRRDSHDGGNDDEEDELDD